MTIWWLIACVPVLTSPAGTGDTTGTWARPVNDWPGVDQSCVDVGEGFSTGEVPLDFRMTDQHADEVSLWQFCGNVTVVDLSAMWCGPCQQLAQDVESMVDDYGADGFVYVTVLTQDLGSEVPDVDDLDNWADSFGIVTQPVLSDGQGWYDGIIVNGSYPVELIIDRDMRARVDGSDDAEIRAAVEEIL
jgi:thiol-disulfide isomerase/thioredoxin